MLSARVHQYTELAGLLQCLYRVVQIGHINNQAGGALMQQLSLSPVIHNDRAGGAGCVGLRSMTW